MKLQYLQAASQAHIFDKLHKQVSFIPISNAIFNLYVVREAFIFFKMLRTILIILNYHAITSGVIIVNINECIIMLCYTYIIQLIEVKNEIELQKAMESIN